MHFDLHWALPYCCKVSCQTPKTAPVQVASSATTVQAFCSIFVTWAGTKRWSYAEFSWRLSGRKQHTTVYINTQLGKDMPLQNLSLRSTNFDFHIRNTIWVSVLSSALQIFVILEGLQIVERSFSRIQNSTLFLHWRTFHGSAWRFGQCNGHRDIGCWELQIYRNL